MDKFKTEQEDFWAGDFGTEYILRNQDPILIESNKNFFSRILSLTNNIESVIEFGPNIGMNLIALRPLLPDASFTGVEINKDAADKLSKLDRVESINSSITNFNSDRKWDLSFTKGLLIHIDPDSLAGVYKKIYESSCKWICIAEYYNPVPIEITYRGHTNKLYKRDFAGEMLEKYDDLKLIDYGFFYHRDPMYPQDDITWFLIKK